MTTITIEITSDEHRLLARMDDDIALAIRECIIQHLGRWHQGVEFDTICPECGEDARTIWTDESYVMCPDCHRDSVLQHCIQCGKLNDCGQLCDDCHIAENESQHVDELQEKKMWSHLAQFDFCMKLVHAGGYSLN